jgi:hypothetical protein
MLHDFRTDLHSDYKMKIIDTIGHIVIGLTLWMLTGYKHSPWVILWQWLPDVFMYPRLAYGLWTGKYLPSYNPFVVLHRCIHGIGGFFFGLALTIINPIIGANFVCHVMWDWYTHWELRKHPRANQIL